MYQQNVFESMYQRTVRDIYWTYQTTLKNYTFIFEKLDLDVITFFGTPWIVDFYKTMSPTKIVSYVAEKIGENYLR